MKNILVIADTAEREQLALIKALSMAKTTVASIHVVIFCHENLNIVTRQEDITESGMQEMIINRTKQWWESYLHSQQITIPIAYEVVWEKHISQWVLDHCQKTHYDLIVKTGHRSESLFYTPTDWRLFRKSSVPIYCVALEQKDVDNVVLVALDLMAISDAKQQLNHRLLEAAFQLSLQTNCDLHCCYATEAPILLSDIDLINPLSSSSFITAQQTTGEQQVATLARDTARKQAVALTKDYDIDDDHIHIQEGVPWRVLTSLGNDLKVRCFVLGTMGRTGIAGKLIGNTAEKVIHHTKKDLLVISPS